MTTNANAPVEKRHIQAAGKVHTAAVRDELAQSLANNEQLRCDLEAVTESLRTANNRLAEIDRIAKRRTWESGGVDFKRVAALASGHTPSPCPSCAAKDGAMAEMQADMSEIDRIASKIGKCIADFRTVAAIAAKYRPPADTLAEALKAAIHALYGGDIAGLADTDRFAAALAELKSRLTGGA